MRSQTPGAACLLSKRPPPPPTSEFHASVACRLGDQQQQPTMLPANITGRSPECFCCFACCCSDDTCLPRTFAISSPALAMLHLSAMLRPLARVIVTLGGTAAKPGCRSSSCAAAAAGTSNSAARDSMRALSVLGDISSSAGCVAMSTLTACWRWQSMAGKRDVKQ
jgi:hypothetical protein